MLDGGGWGLLDADNSKRRVSKANPKHYVLAQFTRHVRPGFTIIDSGDENTVAAFSKALSRLVLVTTNYDNPQSITYDLGAFSKVGGPATRWATSTDASGDKYTRYDASGALKGKAITISFTKNSVQTVEVDNVHM